MALSLLSDLYELSEEYSKESDIKATSSCVSFSQKLELDNFEADNGEAELFSFRDTFNDSARKVLSDHGQIEQK